MFAPILASLAKSFGIMVDKVILSQEQVPIKRFIPLLFALLAFFTILVLPFDNWVSLEAITWPIIGYYFLMITLAFVWNILYYRAVKQKTVQEFEPILMLSPLVVILLAPIIYPNERNWAIIAIALIAGLVLILSNLDRGHIKLSAVSIGLIVCIFLMSFEVIVIRQLLDYFSPASLYFSRCSILFLLFLAYYQSNLIKIKPVAIFGVVITSLLGVMQMIARFYGYQSIGIVFTTLVMSLSPALVYIFGFIFLKERLQSKRLLGGIFIFICVIIAYFIS